MSANPFNALKRLVNQFWNRKQQIPIEPIAKPNIDGYRPHTTIIDESHAIPAGGVFITLSRANGKSMLSHELIMRLFKPKKTKPGKLQHRKYKSQMKRLRRR
jgi:phage terminase large subunit-like protein